MAVSSAARRLLRVLDLEEAWRRRELESAQGELAQLELAMVAAEERKRNGRHLIASGVQSEDLCERLAGIEEVAFGKEWEAVLKQRIHQSTLLIEQLRTALLQKRVERKQAETLIRAAEAKEAIELSRREQQSIDGWYLTRLPEDGSEKDREEQMFKPRSDFDSQF